MDYTPYINVNDFDVSMLTQYTKVKRKKGSRRVNKREYLDIICAFDIETCYIKDIEESVMYIWQYQVDEDITIIGRTWTEFKRFIDNLNEYLLEHDLYIITFVHNLSYEFSFIKSLFDFSTDDVFSVKSRKVLRADVRNIEFRCSYLLTNMSLKMLTQKWKVNHIKLEGDDFDYTEVRFSDTELTKDQLQYCMNDVLGLVEAIKAQNVFNNDNLYSMPYTSTGYVRRDIKTALRPCRYIKELMPTYPVYIRLREAFRGGNTHANRYYVATDDNDNYTVTNVKGADKSSSYPSEQVLRPFPMGVFRHVEKSVDYDTLKSHYIKKRGYACLITLALKNVRLKHHYVTVPYISLSMCRNYKPCDRKNKPKCDNGRIINLDYCEITITDLDLLIIDSQYDFDATIIDLYYTQYGYLPKELRDLVISYYRGKTELKNVVGMEDYYMKYKNLLNSIYGCSAQDIGKGLILYMINPSTGLYDWIPETERSTQQILREAHPVQPYQWGVWVTAWARWDLQRAIDLVGNRFVYCDTDSVYYKGEVDFTALNEEIRKDAIKTGGVATDPDGNKHYMGVWEADHEYDYFKVLNAKCYAGIDTKGKLLLTVAGVPKANHKKNKYGACELQKMGGLDAFKEGACFREGVTISVYHDYMEMTRKEYNGHILEITSNVSILPSTHILGRSKDYIEILQMIDEYLLTMGISRDILFHVPL